MTTALQQLQKEQKKAKREHLELTFKHQLKAVGLGDVWKCQHKFHSERKWAFDFAYVDKKLAIEVEGGTHTGGRHVTGTGYEADCEKYNEAAALGWTLFRFTSRMVTSGKAILFVQDYLKATNAVKTAN